MNLFLTSCRCCGKSVSNQAPACPHCGVSNPCLPPNPPPVPDQSPEPPNLQEAVETFRNTLKQTGADLKQTGAETKKDGPGCIKSSLGCLGVLVVMSFISALFSSCGGGNGGGKWTGEGRIAEINSNDGYVEVTDSRIVYLLTKIGDRKSTSSNPKDKSWEAICVVQVHFNGVKQTGLYGADGNSPGVLTYIWSDKPGEQKLKFKSVGTGDTYTFSK